MALAPIRYLDDRSAGCPQLNSGRQPGCARDDRHPRTTSVSRPMNPAGYAPLSAGPVAAVPPGILTKLVLRQCFCDARMVERLVLYSGSPLVEAIVAAWSAVPWRVRQSDAPNRPLCGDPGTSINTPVRFAR